MAQVHEQDNVPEEKHKNTKANRFEAFEQPVDTNKRTWPTEGVVYVGHLPHGFLEDELKSYFSQYGDVLGVKVARSKKTARSKGYAFIQFRYPEVAQIVADTMNGYLLLGKVLISHTLPANERNPFTFASSHKYKFINWKKMYIQQKNKAKTEEETAFIVHKLLKREEERRNKFKQLDIDYEFPGFKHYIPAEQKTQKAQKVQKVQKVQNIQKVQKSEKVGKSKSKSK